MPTSVYRQVCEIIVHFNLKLEFEILKKGFQAQKSESEHKEITTGSLILKFTYLWKLRGLTQKAIGIPEAQIHGEHL